VSLEPSHVEAWLALANVEARRGRHQPAIDAYRAALDAIGDPPQEGDRRRAADIWCNLAIVSTAAKGFADAVSACRRSLSISETAAAWQRLGEALFSLGRERLDEAAEAFRAALRLDPNALDAHRWLGEIATRRGDLASAASGHDSWFRGWIEGPDAAALRQRQERAIGRGVPPILIAAMLKSASEYIREVLTNLLDVPEIHVSVGAVPTDAVIPSAAR